MEIARIVPAKIINLTKGNDTAAVGIVCGSENGNTKSVADEIA